MADGPPSPDANGDLTLLMRSLRASPGFSLVVLTILGLFGLLGVALVQPGLIGGLFGHSAAAHAGQHFRFLGHRVHDLTFAFLFGTATVGLLPQLWNPAKSAAGQLMALIPWAGLGLVMPLTNYWVNPGAGFVIVATAVFGALTLIATILHPAGSGFFNSFTVSRVNRLMLALVVIAAVPLLAFASTNIELQRTMTNDHAALGHYGFMAAFGFTVIGVGLLASLRPDGWRLSAWVAGFLPALFGLTSVVLPDVDSTLGLAWGLTAIAWGVMFVAGAELIRRRGRTLADLRPYADSDGDTGARPGRGSTARTPLWVYAYRIIAIVLVLLFVILHLTGGGLSGPGMHTPPAGGPLP